MGDVKDKDKLYDALVRQLKLNQEASQDLPNLSSILGQSPEEFYRKSEAEKYYSPIKEQKSEKAYDTIYNKAATDPEISSIPSLLPQRYISPEDKVHMLKRVSENIASGSMNADIMKAKSGPEFIENLLKRENLDSTYEFPKNKPKNRIGEYSADEDNFKFYVTEPGTIVHELGHAIDHKKRNFHTEMQGENPDTVFKTTDKEKELQDLVASGKGSEIAKRLSRGHFSPEGYAQGAIDYPLEQYSKELEKQGFEEEYPETNPKFNKVRTLIKTLRNINK